MYRRIAIAVSAAAVLALAGCGSSGGSSASKPAPAPTSGQAGQASVVAAPTTPAPAEPSTQPSSQPNTLSVIAKDAAGAMSYEISGSPHPGLVSITFTNAGKYAHEMAVSMMKPGVTLDQLKAALKEKDGQQAAAKLLVDPDAEYPVPTIIGPGRSEVDTATLAAGHYVVVCFLPGPDGMPHVMMGMIGEFTVGGDDSAAQPPQPAGTVEMTDKSITVPSEFGAGGTYEVKNTGAKPHDFSLAQLAGKPLPDLFQCVEGSFGNGQPIDKCPGTLAGGVNTLQPGESAFLTITLPPGEYGYLSTEGDGADVQAGLVGTFTVK